MVAEEGSLPRRPQGRVVAEEGSLPRLPQGRVVEEEGSLPHLPQVGLVDSLERYLDHLDTKEEASSFCCGIRMRGVKKDFIKR